MPIIEVVPDSPDLSHLSIEDSRWLYENFELIKDNMNSNFYHEIAAGRVPGKAPVNKFGETTNADSGVATDIWNGANPTDDIAIWIPPTIARMHSLFSNSVNDIILGTGLRTVRVYGLLDWDTTEVSEVVDMNGIGAANTANEYVIIHRLKPLTWGSAGPNVGQIEAVAAVDGTITAMILAGRGQTEMAIYGIPTGKQLLMDAFYASAIKSAVGISGAITLLENPIPKEQLAGFVVKHSEGLMTTGTNFIPHEFHPPKVFTGPSILKLQVDTSSNNTVVSGGFDGVLEDVA